MSFGYSIGDLIAIAGLIERIVIEVKSYKEAPHHFQRLAIELDFLWKVCHQAFHLVSSRVDEQARLERVRAIALQCLGPLQEFEEKMRRYENTLGPVNCTDKSRKGWVRSFKKRLHWSAIARHEVDELRAILTSEILAINTLLTMQNWESLTPGNAANNPFTDRLKALIITTQTASREIETFLVEAKAGSERLEKLVVAANLAQTEHENTLKLVKENAEKTSSVLDAVTDTMGMASSQLTRLFSLTEHLEGWIKTIVQYCNEMIGLVKRNTRILLSLHDIITRLESAMRAPGITCPILEFENPFGIKLALPYQMCDTWEGLCRLLVVMFYDKPGHLLVKGRRFVVMQSRTNMPIKPETWSTSVVPGDSLNMSLLLDGLGNQSTKVSCPRCGHLFDSTPSGFQRGYQCPECLLLSHTVDRKQLGISYNSWTLPVPVHLEDLLMKFGIWLYPSTGDKDVDLSAFRRVHVIPSEEDFFPAFFGTGAHRHNLLFEYSSDHEINIHRLRFGLLFGLIEFKRVMEGERG